VSLEKSTVSSILNSATFKLGEINQNSPRLDAELLLSYVLNCPRFQLVLNGEQQLNDDQLVKFFDLLRKRSLGCPVAYLTNKKEFWSLTLEVSKDTLIPRPDTETLVETVVDQIFKWKKTNKGNTCCIAELGTGTAAIPLALCSELTNLHITSVDFSDQILQIAARNIHSYKYLLSPRKNQLNIVLSDLFSAIESLKNFDFIISNPPYIPSHKIANLQTEVSQFEPRKALDGGKDGLFFYRYLLNVASGMLKRNGKMILEIGFDQQHALTKLKKRFPAWTSNHFLHDLQDNVRVWILVKGKN
tara:strand:+ start:1290 stop:2195 length:906 start_codon:yes stop_codon:yes gene_type:complete